MSDLTTIPEIIEAAKKNLTKELWDFAAGGTGSETTLRRNRAALDRYAFKPRVLRDVSGWSTETQLLGHTLALPVMLAPVGPIARYHPDGALAVARAAGRMGTIGFVSTMASPALEEVMTGATGPMVFQLYVGGDHEWVDTLVKRVESAGYAALCLTVDIVVPPFRERNLRNRYVADRRETLPNLRGIGWFDQFRARFTWEDLAWLRSRTKLPLILKGVRDPADAVLAIEHGVDVVYVSNHGGRTLDHEPATMDVLQDIVKAIDGRAEVIVDSGFLRGADVLKGIALGACAVAVGKLTCWAMAAGGEAGLQQTLEILQAEMDSTMGNMGVTSLSELGPEHLTQNVTPVPLEPALDDGAY